METNTEVQDQHEPEEHVHGEHCQHHHHDHGVTVRNEHKIGRNDPCYCGSGKKFKKCCYQ